MLVHEMLSIFKKIQGVLFFIFIFILFFLMLHAPEVKVIMSLMM